MELTASEILQYKQVQKLAYESAQKVKEEMYVGMTELQAANRLDQILESFGVKNFFHTSFAWFGERSSFTNFKTYFDFQPTEKKLELGMSVILDTAPALNGFPCDIGYAFSFGENPEVDKAILDLEIFRKIILDGILAEKKLSVIYSEVDEVIVDLGYTNCHKFYPAEVLGHKVGKLPFLQLPSFKILGFHSQTYAYLLGETLEGILPKIDLFGNKNVPYWNATTHHRAEAGIWAVEPHIGKGDIGVKWEELLIVTENSAYWLDDDLPHVNFWKQGKVFSVG